MIGSCDQQLARLFPPGGVESHMAQSIGGETPQCSATLIASLQQTNMLGWRQMLCIVLPNMFLCDPHFQLGGYSGPTVREAWLLQEAKATLGTGLVFWMCNPTSEPLVALVR